MTPCFALNVAHVKVVPQRAFPDRRLRRNPTWAVRPWAASQWEGSPNRPHNNLSKDSRAKVCHSKACHSKDFHLKRCPSKAFRLRA